MSNAKIFKVDSNHNATEFPGYLASLEKNIQTIFEKNLLTLLGVQFIASGSIIVKKPKKRFVDILGLDYNNYPVIIELKRWKDQGIMNQGLAYQFHLNDHRGDFYVLVEKTLGTAVAKQIDWSVIRIICIASTHRDYDKEAVIAVGKNIDLIEYKLFGDDLIMIDPVFIGAKKNYKLDNGAPAPDCKHTTGNVENGQKRRAQRLVAESWKYKSIYEHLIEYVENLGDDIEIRVKKAYTAASRMTNFVSFQALKDDLRVSMEMTDEDAQQLKASLPTGVWNRIKCDYKTSTYKKDHMLLNFNIKTVDDAEFTKPFIERSYERS